MSFEIDRSSLRRLAACWAALGLAAGAASAQVRISQIFGGGGNTAAPYTSDYIELYNSGPAQSVAGWSVQYASAAGSAWTATALPSVTLATGQYLLIKEASGTATPAGQSLALPPQDAGGASAMSASDGKVALVSTIVALNVAAPTSGAQPQVLDLVGYGAASWNEAAFFGGGFSAANNAPTGSNSAAIHRNACGAADSNDNASDFATGDPQPRNSLVALNTGLAAGAMCNPYFAEPLQTVRVTVFPYLCGGGAALPTSVSLDATDVGAGGLALFDDGTGGDVVAGDGIWSINLTVANGTAAGTKSMPLVFTDGVASGGLYASLEVKPTSTPDNDNCSTATVMSGAFPVFAPGNFTGATCEYNTVLHSSSPTVSQSSRRGLWYTFTGTGHTMTFDTCSSPLIGSAIPDTVVMILCGTCDGATAIAFNNDNPTLCGTGSGTERRSRVSFCTQAGRPYFAWVGAFATGPQTFAITCRLDDDGTSCTGATSCDTCPPPTPVGAIAEGEPGYGPATNDGCDSTASKFKDVTVAPSPADLVITGSSRGYAAIRDADWYRFQAPSNGMLTATVTGQMPMLVELHQLSATGACTGEVMVAGAPLVSQRCASTSVSANVTNGAWYAVRALEVGFNIGGGSAFGGHAVGGDSYHYALDIQLDAAPSNDACVGASPLALGASANGDTTLASNDGASSCDALGRDLWYSVTTATPGRLRIDTCGSAIDTVVSLYASCGGAEIACNDDSVGCTCSAPASALDVANLAAGTYLVRVSDKLIGAGGSFVARATLDETLDGNDSCCDALTLAVPSVTSSSTVGATTESPAPPACVGPLPGGAQSFAYTDGVWYRVNVPTTRTVTLDTLASSFDTRMWVFDASGGCNALSCVTANDDISSIAGQSTVAWIAQGGVEYRVLVAPATNVPGSFTLTASSDATPVNDDCSAPHVLTGIAGSVSGTTAGATAFLNTATSANPACQPSASYGMFDVWYAYTAPCAGSVTFATCGGYDTIVSVHSSCPTATSSQQIAGACNLDGPGACSPGSSVTVAMNASETVLIRVAGQDGALSGAFTLTYNGVSDADLDGTPDCLDGCPLDASKLAPGVCGCGASDVDSDGDTFADCVDGCPTDPAKQSPGVCGCGASDVDTDGDSFADCIDGCPNDAAKQSPGTCGCGVSEADTDGDAVLDCIDGCPLDPNKQAPGLCGCGDPDVDSDGDTVLDCFDGCPNDAAKQAPGACGCGVSDLDSDGDSVADCIDGCPSDPAKQAPGQCGCGMSELDSDGDTFADCVDGCPDDPAKSAPGQCGCGASDLDSDGDTFADCVDGCPADPGKQAPGTCGCGVSDADTDNDGVLDCNDNCDPIANPLQEDCDSDGVGNVCELAQHTAWDVDSNGVPDNCQPGVIITYCTSGTSVNACTPVLTSTGTPSASQPSGFTILSSGNDGNRNGGFFYGITGPHFSVFASGFMCVKAPRQRSPVFLTGGTTGTCTGGLSLDVNVYAATHPGALGTPLTTGVTYFWEGYNRDSGGPGNLVLSNALALTFLP